MTLQGQEVVVGQRVKLFNSHITARGRVLQVTSDGMIFVHWRIGHGADISVWYDPHQLECAEGERSG